VRAYLVGIGLASDAAPAGKVTLAQRRGIQWDSSDPGV
jgi:hypothetical protein